MRCKEWVSAAVVVVLGLVLVLVLPPHATARADKAKKPKLAAATKVDCTTTAKRKARGIADKAVKAKDYKLAIATLEPYSQSCSASGDEATETAWLVGDLSVAYLLAADYIRCKGVLEPLIYPKSDVSRSGSDKLTSALQFNFDQCEKKFDAQYTALKSDKCPFTIDSANGSALAPASLVPRGATAACVALVSSDDKPAPKKADDDDLAPVSCPAVALVSKGAGGKLTKRVLGKLDGDDTFCCGYNKIAVGIKDGQSLIRVGADTWVRECHGGTATTSLDTIYELKNNALEVIVDASNVLW